jgi:hypothetical protein
MTTPLRVQLARSADVDHPCCGNLAVVTPRPDNMHAAELRCAGCGKFRGWLSREAFDFLSGVARRWGSPEILTLSNNQIGDHEMGTNTQRENSGILFKNDRKQNDNSPDYTGSINVAGVEYQISGWIKQGAKAKFMSLAVKPPKSAGETKQTAPANDFHNDSIPF